VLAGFAGVQQGAAAGASSEMLSGGAIPGTASTGRHLVVAACAPPGAAGPAPGQRHLPPPDGSDHLRLRQCADRLLASYPRVSGGDLLTDAIAWARANLNRQLSLDELAARAPMSRRSSARLFKAAPGVTPHAWLPSRAEEHLESITLPIEQIAGRAGHRSAAVFREQFTARRGIPPATAGPSAGQVSASAGNGDGHCTQRQKGCPAGSRNTRKVVPG
jgi:AraC-like DNA-binding protein